MTIPPKYEDVVAKLDAALGREAALREELNQYEPASPGTASKRARWLLNIQDACKYGLPKHLVQRLNNTTKEIQNSIKYGGTKRLRDESTALQQRLTFAEQRAGELESAAREMLRIAGIANQGSNAYNRAIINLHNALNPVETPYEYSGEDDFGHRERIDAELKPAEEGELS